jgi:hypothetical protein
VLSLSLSVVDPERTLTAFRQILPVSVPTVGGYLPDVCPGIPDRRSSVTIGISAGVSIDSAPAAIARE